jgi:hypothetical protein
MKLVRELKNEATGARSEEAAEAPLADVVDRDRL